jgi:glucose/arabinose dehydrogenase
MIRKFLVGLGLVIAAIIIGGWLFWPENLVVRGPMLDVLLGRQVETPGEGTIRSRFRLPDGFRIGLFAEGVPHARVMKFTATGDMVVTSMREGNVVLLHRDANGDGLADGCTLLLSGLAVPHGLALHDGYLYVAEETRIIRAPYDAAARTLGAAETVFTGMPSGGNHRTRTLGFGPDGMLYVTVGSSCNVCEETEPYRAAMVRMKPDGSDAETFATGLRNTVGFDWQPGTGALYGTDNGRDLLGDNTPHCELNRIVAGGDYGWPYAYDDQVPDPDFGPGNADKVAASLPLAHGFGAHRAPLGIRFLRPGLAPAGYDGAALVALHGSWNRSTLAGYKVVSLHWGADGSITQRDFLTGFELDEDVIGRPADVVQGPDGAIYVSDDYAGAVYRIGWGDLAVADTADTAAQQQADPLAAYGDDERTALAEAGRALFERHACGACHVPAMAPEGVAVKKLDNLAGRYDVPGIRQLLTVPPGPMPVYDLTDAEKEALAVYLLGRAE